MQDFIDKLSNFTPSSILKSLIYIDPSFICSLHLVINSDFLSRRGDSISGLDFPYCSSLFDFKWFQLLNSEE